MPKFLVKTSGFVLIDLHRGKRYVGAPQVHRMQAPQKGDTCGLYAFNPLRFRFGNQYLATNRDRHIELVFSTYRRAINKIDANKPICELLLEEIRDFLASDLKKITVADVKNYLLELEKNLAAFKKLSSDTVETQNQIQQYKEICQEFLDNDYEYDDFEEFLIQKANIDLIKLAQRTIASLSFITAFEPKEVLNNYVNESIKSVVNSRDNYGSMLRLTLDNPEFLAPIYHQAVLNLAASCFQLEGSDWDPTKPIEALMETLEEFGPQVIYTEPCVLFDSSNCKLEVESDTYKIYSAGKSIDEKEGCHSLLIVGAENCDGEPFVYLSDPNVPAPLKGPSPLYKIPYSELLMKIHNIYGVSLQEDADKIKGPFSFQAKKGNFDRLYDFVNGHQPYQPLDNPNKTRAMRPSII
ncbi:hypothetical protein [Legionella sp. 29fVS95]|uniref:hypothetical protein n=1 Tax=Legionella sp. 29fVS95 TaxID=3402813 RepID=UPI003AF49799